MRTVLAVTAVIFGAVVILTAPGRGGAPVEAPLLRVDPNEAPRGVLLALPRIGPALAGRIVAERREAPLLGPEDLDLRVRGIGPATVEALRPYLVFPLRP